MLTEDEIRELRAENARWYAAQGYISNRGLRPADGPCTKRGFDSASAASSMRQYLHEACGKWHNANADKRTR